MSFLFIKEVVLVSPNPTKWSDTLKQNARYCQQIVWVSDHFVGLALQGLKKGFDFLQQTTLKEKFYFKIKESANLSFHIWNVVLGKYYLTASGTRQCCFMLLPLLEKTVLLILHKEMSKDVNFL